MNSVYKKLGKNIILFGSSSFGVKIVQFALIPLYTNCLTTVEYGTIDLLSIVLQLLIPIFTLDVADAVTLFTLKNENDKESVFNNALKIILLGSVILLLILFVLKCCVNIKCPLSYMAFIFMGFLFNSIYSSISNYFRGLEKISDIAIAGIISALVNAVCNIFFLLLLKLGINGYLIANIVGIILPTVFLIIRGYHYGVFKIRKSAWNKDKLQTEMLKYSTPLIFSATGWWIYASGIKFLLVVLCGTSTNGIFVAANKIPSILFAFVTLLNQALVISIVQEFDKNGFISKTYSVYNSVMTMLCCGILLLNIPIAHILYLNDFFQAWQYTGMLVIANLFGSLSLFISNVFICVKDSKNLAKTTIGCGALNIILGYLLIKSVGMQGAGIALLISNFVLWLCRMKKVQQYVYLRIKLRRDFLAYLLLLMQCVMGMHSSHIYVGQIICVLIVVALYRNEFKTVIRKLTISVKNHINKR